MDIFLDGILGAIEMQVKFCPLIFYKKAYFTFGWYITETKHKNRKGGSSCGM